MILLHGEKKFFFHFLLSIFFLFFLSVKQPYTPYTFIILILKSSIKRGVGLGVGS